MIIKMAGYVIEVDVEKTREYYLSKDSVNDCTCTGCQNYRRYTEVCDDKIRTWFQQFGIDDLKYIAEILPYNTEEDGRVFYGGFYHVCGKITKDTEKKNDITMEEKQEKSDGIQYFPPGLPGIILDKDYYEAFFSQSCLMLASDFPRPALQIEIFARIPWLIEAVNDY